MRPSLLLLLIGSLVGGYWLLLTQITPAPAGSSPTWLDVDDFVEYWAAGRLNLMGQNPYGADDLLALQQHVGWDDAMPIMMWNPPPVLTLVMPFGLLDYQPARLVWLLLSLMLVLVIAHHLWAVYGGPPKLRARALLLPFTFIPTLFVLDIGQIGVWVLLGLVTLGWGLRQQRWAWAGAALLLLAIKPHVAYLVWLALGLWWLRERKWTMLLGAGGALAVTWLLPTLINPAVNQQYITAVTTAPPLYWKTMTLGFLLRQWLGPQHDWLQFIPPALGTLWLLWYWRDRYASWDWHAELPLLVLVSTTTMAFGWPFDLVILLPALLQIAVWITQEPSRRYQLAAAVAYIGLNGIALWQNQSTVGQEAFVWMPGAYLLFYLAVRHRHLSWGQSL